ncbi:hypothetical protein Dsin_010189 [Dipteronia sinensis]|uniref:Uncharacterized protein n=1 Tax=Dipteronia sinensis TaxID=43782 RepID=A0AAE0ECL9_9ROSI|nr:hypothetical protein Dsin_010189 [Dipteronia sinensis]
MAQLQILSSQTINPRLYPSHSLSTTKGNGSSSISLTQNIFTKKKKLSVKCPQSKCDSNRERENSSSASWSIAAEVGHSIREGSSSSGT